MLSLFTLAVKPSTPASFSWAFLGLFLAEVEARLLLAALALHVLFRNSALELAREGEGRVEAGRLLG